MNLAEAIFLTSLQIQTMPVSDSPTVTDNKPKCDACSVCEHCMPGETAILALDQAEGTGWEGTTPGDLV